MKIALSRCQDVRVPKHPARYDSEKQIEVILWVKIDSDISVMDRGSLFWKCQRQRRPQYLVRELEAIS